MQQQLQNDVTVKCRNGGVCSCLVKPQVQSITFIQALRKVLLLLMFG